MSHYVGVLVEIFFVAGMVDLCYTNYHFFRVTLVEVCSSARDAAMIHCIADIAFLHIRMVEGLSSPLPRCFIMFSW